MGINYTPEQEAQIDTFVGQNFLRAVVAEFEPLTDHMAGGLGILAVAAAYEGCELLLSGHLLGAAVYGGAAVAGGCIGLEVQRTTARFRNLIGTFGAQEA
jgi:hypothetical protein